MHQLKTLFAKFSLQQKITILVVFAAVVGGIVGLSQWNHERDFKPMFGGLSAEDAGAIVARLKETGVEYRVSDNGSTVLVPEAKVAETRIQMAAAGIPKTGRIGYELFDKNNFGATDFTEQVNFHRALEGELERSIMSISEVEQARVHVTLPKQSLFLENRQPAKASVMVKVRPGTRLANQNVLAMTHLVSSAVEGLTPEGVSILDMHGNLLSRPRRSPSPEGAEPSDAVLEYRQSLEKDLLAKINTTLEPVLGPERFRAGVSVDCDFTSGEQSEETFDPAKSVMVTSQKTEDVNGGTAVVGVPGSASSLPRPTSRPSVGGTGVSRKTENVTYQSSRSVRRIRLPQGTVKRMSVAVLVAQNVRWEGSGAKANRVVEPPSPEKLKVIRDLVAGATGIQAERGDQLIVESLPFETLMTAPPEPPAVTSQPQPGPIGIRLPPQLQDPGVLIGAGAGAVVVLLLIGFLMMRSKRKRRQKAESAAAAAAAAKELAQPPDADAMRKQIEASMAEQSAIRDRKEMEALAALKAPPVKTQKAEVLSKHLSEEAKKDPQTMVHILRSWMNES